MAVAGTALTPGGTTGWNQQVWAKTFQKCTYQRMKFVPVIEEGQRLYGQLNVRKHARITGSVLAQSADGTGLTYLNIIGTPVSVTPIGNVVPVAWSDNEDAQVDANFNAEAGWNVEASMAELIETNTLANIQALTQIMSAPGVTAAMLREGLARLQGSTNGFADVGGKETVYGIFTNTQLPNLMAIPEVNSAEMRGDSENPYVRGVWVKGFGFTLMTSTVIAQDANGWHNALFHPTAFIIAWNQRAKIKRQEVEAQSRVIAYSNQGSAVLHDARAWALRTTASAY